jgi:hypothetical protein
MASLSKLSPAEFEAEMQRLGLDKDNGEVAGEGDEDVGDTPLASDDSDEDVEEIELGEDGNFDDSDFGSGDDDDEEEDGLRGIDGLSDVEEGPGSGDEDLALPDDPAAMERVLRRLEEEYKVDRGPVQSRLRGTLNEAEWQDREGPGVRG